MEFPAKKTDAAEKQKQYEQSDMDLAYSFAKAAHKEFGYFLKAIVLFGSRTKKGHKSEGDIDILLIIDDVAYAITDEVVEAYRIIVEGIIVRTSRKIHVTTLKFTSFWEYMRVGDPVGLNILRDGVAMIDTGFFTPIQMLLFSGKVRPSNEAVMVYMSRAPQALHNAKWHMMQATLDLYWAAIDASHAILMHHGYIPPGPADVAPHLEELANKGLIDKKCPKIMHFLYDTSKKILHRKINDIPGKDFDTYHKMAEELVEEIKKRIKK